MESLKLWWNQNRELVVKRLKSLLWRAGCMGAVASINAIVENLSGLGLPPVVTTMLGLALGELTKWLNNHTNLFGGKQK